MKTKLQDGSTIVWEEKAGEPLQVGKFYSLKFSVLAPDGKPAHLQPYLGMMGHAAVIKDDGAVYIPCIQRVLFRRLRSKLLKNVLPIPLKNTR